MNTHFSFQKYFNVKNRYDGETAQILFTDLYNNNSSKNILFLRTPSTGGWMDNMLLSAPNVTRILYKTEKNMIPHNNSTIIIEQSELETFIESLNKKFDLICMDPFHEYYESYRDLSLLSSYLSDDGILISHDCCPQSKEYAYPTFTRGRWSGITYGCLVELAYNNQQWFYGVLDVDTGIAIISKKNMEGLSQNFNRDKQEILIKMMKEQNENTYDYYKENGKELINLIQRQL